MSQSNVIKKNGAEDRTWTGTVVTYRRILSPVRLPIPPPRHNLKLLDFIQSETSASTSSDTWYLLVEAATGFEPVVKVLQTSALPLGYAAIWKWSILRSIFGADDEIRTRDPRLGKAMLYHWATSA